MVPRGSLDIARIELERALERLLCPGPIPFIEKTDQPACRVGFGEIGGEPDRLRRRVTRLAARFLRRELTVVAEQAVGVGNTSPGEPVLRVERERLLHQDEPLL